MKSKEIRLLSSRVVVGDRKESLGSYLPHGGRVIVVTEDRLAELYFDFLTDFEVIRIAGGEEHKNLETVERLVGELVDREADRTTFLVGFGGGMVCDVVGFTASVFMRGCRFGFVPTTLLAQVDASVGGKNGVNFHGYKNMIGVFRQPEWVICDPTLLRTLEHREFVAGLAEVVKAAIIGDATLFDYLECHVASILQKEENCLLELIAASVAVKVRIVEADEREGGLRRLLNFGHTVGHALERHDCLLHGEAVSVGMCIVAHWAERFGILHSIDRKRIEHLLTAFGLPIRSTLPVEVWKETMWKDKKRERSGIHVIFPERVGKCVDRLVELDELNVLGE